MTVHPNQDAETAKRNGNDLFSAKDYEGAIKYYTEAMTLDHSQPNYPLNRSFAHLKLQKWSEAEADATLVLALDPKNPKALYRRSLARKEQDDFSGARADIFAFAQAGGDLGLLTDEIIKISVGEANAVLATTDTPSSGFEIRAARERDWGAFASRPFTRGDLILVETPLYSVHEDPNPDEVLRAVERLTHTERSSVAQLKNAYAEDPLYPDPFVGVHSTNAFAAGEDQSVLCLRASRFNHSCSPNARHSWHAPSKTFRIYALRPIAAGDEILVCYISGRNVYGSTRAQRQARLKHKLAFTCACTVCALPEPERAASDRRREEVAGLWETVPYFMPHQIVDRLETIALGVRLMREEGYCADADDFTNDAAAICGYHSDWVAVRYWALETYATRVAEFGGDSLHVTKAEMQTLLFRPQEYQMAGMGKRMVLDVRL